MRPGWTNPQGNVLGLMPHSKHVRADQHPDPQAHPKDVVMGSLPACSCSKTWPLVMDEGGRLT
ncbi:MAG: hypothetical protein R2857_09730 [Vampirovibrionales bacterium]